MRPLKKYVPFRGAALHSAGSRSPPPLFWRVVHVPQYFTDVIKQPADHTYVDLRIGISLLAVALACVAQFYPRPFPENKAVLAVCVVLYIVCQVVMQYIASYKQKNIVYRSKPGPVRCLVDMTGWRVLWSEAGERLN